MTPLERAARAYHDSTRQFRYVRDCLRPSAPPIARPVPFVEWDDLDDETRSERKKQVRAVLKAMREPSEGMTVRMAEAVEAATEIAAEANCERPARLQALAAQAAFIDAALSEKPE